MTTVVSRKEQDRDRFLAHFPKEISKRVCDYVRDVILLKSRYIFTTREKGLQYGYCTHCTEKYRTVGLKQNEKVACVKCGSMCVVKKSGLSRKYLVDRAHFVFYEKSAINPSAIIARSMYVCRDYSGSYHNVETRFSPSAMYLFEMGNSEMYEPYWGSNEWRKSTSITSQYSSSYTGGYRSSCPKAWIKEAAAGTPFQYSTWEQYHETDSVKFFSLFSKYPCVEYLTKLEMKYFVSAKLNNGLTYSAIDWRGKTLDKVLKLSKQRAKEFIRSIGNVTNPLTLRLFQISCNEKSGHTLDQLETIADRFDNCWPLLQKLLKHTSLRRADGYVSKQQAVEKKHNRPCQPTHIMHTWRDYVADCKRLDLNLADDAILFPSDLHKAHQRTIQQIKYKEDEELNRRIRERKKMREKYTFKSDGFFIRAAHDSKELIGEGKALSHCVGSYAERYASGKCDILVIRRVSEPDKPYFTMEIQDRKIMQCRGNRNCGMTDDVQQFVDKFKELKLNDANRMPKTNIGSANRQEAAV